MSSSHLKFIPVILLLICGYFKFIYAAGPRIISPQLLAPYQVGLRLAESYAAGDKSVTNLCNGIIISSRYILTTAGCVHMPTPWGTLSPILPTSLYIVAGKFSLSSNDGGIKRNVVSVIVHDKFNPVNYTNDIALLKLDRPLTFDGSNVNWIELQNNTVVEKGCTIYPTNGPPTNYSTNPPIYSMVSNISQIDAWFCNKTNSTIPQQICLLYTTSNLHLCNSTAQNVQRYTPERGTSMVCSNRVSGLLSEIHKPISVEQCLSAGKTFATYTRVSEFVAWIKAETGLWTNASTEVLPPSWSQTHKDPRGSADKFQNSAVLFIVTLALVTLL